MVNDLGVGLRKIKHSTLKSLNLPQKMGFLTVVIVLPVIADDGLVVICLAVAVAAPRPGAGAGAEGG